MRVLADQRSLRGVPASLSWSPVDGDGRVTTAGGTVTVSVARDNGTSLVSGASTSGSGPYTYTLAATHTAPVDVLTVTWLVDGIARETRRLEIVGGYYANLDTIATRQPKVAGEQNADVVVQVRAEVEQEFEDACQVAFVPRYRRERIRVQRTSDTLVLGEVELRSVRSCTIRIDNTVWEELDSTDLAAIKPNRAGLAIRTNAEGWPAGAEVEIAYEHGYDRPSQRVVRAFLDRLAERINQKSSGISPRAMQAVAEGVTVNLATPGRGQWITGNPDVDVVLMAERRERWGVA